MGVSLCFGRGRPSIMSISFRVGAWVGGGFEGVRVQGWPAQKYRNPDPRFRLELGRLLSLLFGACGAGSRCRRGGGQIDRCATACPRTLCFVVARARRAGG